MSTFTRGGCPTVKGVVFVTTISDSLFNDQSLHTKPKLSLQKRQNVHAYLVGGCPKVQGAFFIMAISDFLFDDR